MPRSRRIPPNPNVLLVEGTDERLVIPELIEANGIIWGETYRDWIVEIVDMEGVSNLLRRGTIEAEIKASGVKALGIILDADQNIEANWNMVRERCLGEFPDIPAQIPAEGLVITNSDSLRLGIWMMPDNQSRGMFETFLMFLAPNTESDIHELVTRSVDEAASRNAGFRQVHRPKALVHTWLAWQDPPGEPLNHAIKEQLLSSTCPYAAPFVAWFKTLYQI